MSQSKMKNSSNEAEGGIPPKDPSCHYLFPTIEHVRALSSPAMLKALNTANIHKDNPKELSRMGDDGVGLQAALETMLSSIVRRRKLLVAAANPMRAKNARLLKENAAKNPVNQAPGPTTSSSQNFASNDRPGPSSAQGSAKSMKTRRSERLQSGSESDPNCEVSRDEKDRVNAEFQKFLEPYFPGIDSSHVDEVLGLQRNHRRNRNEAEKIRLSLPKPADKPDATNEKELIKADSITPTSRAHPEATSTSSRKTRSGAKRESSTQDDIGIGEKATKTEHTDDTEIIENLTQLNELSNQTVEMLRKLRDIAEVERLRTSLSQSLEILDKDIREIYEHTQFLKKHQLPMPDEQRTAALKALESRNMVLQKLSSLEIGQTI